MEIRDIHQIARERQKINDAIRMFFKGRGYVEVETPILVRSPGMEPNLTPFETVVRETNGLEHRAALITSPENSMKKLLGFGMQKIFTLTKVFRNEEEFGGAHNPEFTMLEWYQQGADYHVCMDETEELVREVFLALCHSEAPQAPKNQEDRLLHARVRDLFLTHIGVDLDSSGIEELRQACQQLGIHKIQTDTESDLFYRLFLTKIEPELSTAFVYDYPTYQASLARLTPSGSYGERFELYMNGLEICNGFTELTDATEQRARFEEEARERQATGKTVHPIDEEFLRLLPSLRSPTFGNALGVDRLHMVLTGRTRIEDVILFTSNELFI